MPPIARDVINAAAVAFGLFPVAANALSDTNLLGTYGFDFSGTDNAVTGKEIVASGVFVPDGLGNILRRSSITYNDGGSICSGTLTKGSYKVDVHGTGTMSMTFQLSGVCPLGPTFKFAFAVGYPADTGIERIVHLSSTTFTVSGTETTAVAVAGRADHF